MKKLKNILESKKARIAVAIVAVAIIAAVLLASSTCARQTSDSNSDSAPANTPALEETTPTENNVVDESEAIATQENEPDQEGQDNEKAESYAASATEPSDTSEPAQTPNNAAAPAQANSPSSNPDNHTETSNPSANTTATEPVRRWIEETSEVWVVDSAAWTEEVPVYETVTVSICNVCGAEMTGSTYEHNKAHMLAGEGGGFRTTTKRVQTGTDQVFHQEVGHFETVVTGGHWE